MSASKSILDSLLAVLKLAIDSTYYKQPIASDIDQKIRDHLHMMESIERAELTPIFQKINGENLRVLELFAERMASLSVRQNKIDPARDGLLALLLCSSSGDPRDLIMILSLLHDAAVKTTGSAEEVFRDVSSVFGGEGLLSEFLERTEEDKSIDSMGYEESQNEGGFVYVRSW